MNKLNHAPLILCDDASLTLRDIRQICRTVKREHGLGMVAVDYIGLIKGEQRNASRYDVVTEISKGLKRLAIPACHAGGRGFESRPLRHSLPLPSSPPRTRRLPLEGGQPGCNERKSLYRASCPADAQR